METILYSYGIYVKFQLHSKRVKFCNRNRKSFNRKKQIIKEIEALADLQGPKNTEKFKNATNIDLKKIYTRNRDINQNKIVMIVQKNIASTGINQKNIKGINLDLNEERIVTQNLMKFMERKIIKIAEVNIKKTIVK